MLSDNEELILIGNRIRERREAIGMSQDELASETGTTKSTIHRIEAGTQEMRILTLKRMADALGCTQDYILSGEDLTLNLDPVIETIAVKMARLDSAAKSLCISQTQSLIDGLSNL